MKYLGSVDNVIRGIVPEGCADRWILASSFAYAFEIGSPQGVSTMGEMVALGGHVYTKNPETYQLITGEGLITTGAFIIPHDVTPTRQVNWKWRDVPMSIVYEEIHEGPTAFAGVMHCNELHGTAISKAPIHGENIFENKESYYAKEPVTIKDAHVAIVGVIAKKGLDIVLYRNPFEKKGSLLAHSHVLLLNKPVDRVQDVQPEDVQDVLHLFPNSKVGSVSLDVYPIEELSPF